MRLFWALELPGALKERLEGIQATLREAAGDAVRWVAPEQFHVTCKFIGEVEGAAEIVEIVEACELPGPFELEIHGVGSFNGFRVLWAGIEGSGLPALNELVERIERAHETIAIPSTKNRFHAHVTLGRARRNRLTRADRARTRLASAMKELDFEPMPFIAPELVLYDSVQARPNERPSYRAVARLALG